MGSWCCFRRHRSDPRPSSRPPVLAVGRRRRLVGGGPEKSPRQFRGLCFRTAYQEIAVSVGGRPCHGRAGHSRRFPSLAPPKNIGEEGSPPSRLLMLKKTYFETRPL